MKQFKKGDKVRVMDKGLLMLQQFAPKGAKPNNEGIVDEVDGDTVYILFPIGNDKIEEHSQLVPYDISIVNLIPTP